jgi:hypothetical protein
MALQRDAFKPDHPHSSFAAFHTGGAQTLLDEAPSTSSPANPAKPGEAIHSPAEANACRSP